MESKFNRDNVVPIKNGNSPFMEFKKKVEQEMSETSIFKQFVADKFGVEMGEKKPLDFTPVMRSREEICRLIEKLESIQEGIDGYRDSIQKERIKNSQLALKISVVQKSLDNAIDDLMLSSDVNSAEG
jgi:hypothetical protein